MTQQPPASPDQPGQQDQQDPPSPFEQPSEAAAQTEVASEPQLPDQPVEAPPPPPPAAAAPPKKRRVGLIVTLTVVGALALVAAGGFVLVNLLREELPQVGDCLTNAPTADEMDVVACDAPEATWNVIGSDGTWTWGDFDSAAPGELCGGFPATEQALWVTTASGVEDGTEGEVVCLTAIGGGDPADQ